MPAWETLAADLILVVHFSIVLFITLSVPMIWLGWFLEWRFVRNMPYRLIHLGLMGFVAGQALLGRLCPLTLWEFSLRNAGGSGAGPPVSFIQRWVGRLLFFDAEPRVFTIVYLTFFSLVIVTWIFVRPVSSHRRAPALGPGRGHGIERVPVRRNEREGRDDRGQR